MVRGEPTAALMRNVQRFVVTIFETHGAEVSSTAFEQVIRTIILSNPGLYVEQPSDPLKNNFDGTKNAQRRSQLIAKHLTGTHTNAVSQLCEFCILRNPLGGMMTALRPLGTTDRATKLLMRFDDAGQPVFMAMPQEQRALVGAPRPKPTCIDTISNFEYEFNFNKLLLLVGGTGAGKTIMFMDLVDQLVNYCSDTQVLVTVASGKHESAHQFNAIFHGKVAEIEGTDCGNPARPKMNELRSFMEWAYSMQQRLNDTHGFFPDGRPKFRVAAVMDDFEELLGEILSLRSKGSWLKDVLNKSRESGVFFLFAGQGKNKTVFQKLAEFPLQIMLMWTMDVNEAEFGQRMKLMNRSNLSDDDFKALVYYWCRHPSDGPSRAGGVVVQNDIGVQKFKTESALAAAWDVFARGGGNAPFKVDADQVFGVGELPSVLAEAEQEAAQEAAAAQAADDPLASFGKAQETAAGGINLGFDLPAPASSSPPSFLTPVIQGKQQPPPRQFNVKGTVGGDSAGGPKSSRLLAMSVLAAQPAPAPAPALNFEQVKRIAEQAFIEATRTGRLPIFDLGLGGAGSDLGQLLEHSERCPNAERHELSDAAATAEAMKEGNMASKRALSVATTTKTELLLEQIDGLVDQMDDLDIDEAGLRTLIQKRQDIDNQMHAVKKKQDKEKHDSKKKKGGGSRRRKLVNALNDLRTMRVGVVDAIAEKEAKAAELQAQKADAEMQLLKAENEGDHDVEETDYGSDRDRDEDFEGDDEAAAPVQVEAAPTNGTYTLSLTHTLHHTLCHTLTVPPPLLQLPPLPPLPLPLPLHRLPSSSHRSAKTSTSRRWRLVTATKLLCRRRRRWRWRRPRRRRGRPWTRRRTRRRTALPMTRTWTTARRRAGMRRRTRLTRSSLRARRRAARRRARRRRATTRRARRRRATTRRARRRRAATTTVTATTTTTVNKRVRRSCRWSTATLPNLSVYCILC